MAAPTWAPIASNASRWASSNFFTPPPLLLSFLRKAALALSSIVCSITRTYSRFSTPCDIALTARQIVQLKDVGNEAVVEEAVAGRVEVARGGGGGGGGRQLRRRSTPQQTDQHRNDVLRRREVVKEPDTAHRGPDTAVGGDESRGQLATTTFIVSFRRGVRDEQRRQQQNGPQLSNRLQVLQRYGGQQKVEQTKSCDIVLIIALTSAVGVGEDGHDSPAKAGFIISRRGKQLKKVLQGGGHRVVTFSEGGQHRCEDIDANEGLTFALHQHGHQLFKSGSFYFNFYRLQVTVLGDHQLNEGELDVTGKVVKELIELRPLATICLLKDVGEIKKVPLVKAEQVALQGVLGKLFSQGYDGDEGDGGDETPMISKEEEEEEM
ncbi:hypothetical protein TYRP_002449 [Tyrophagus putrescentiae]|nr:hypothetical protein TYRP_002449 [Tyrophagus putrescentiae]